MSDDGDNVMLSYAVALISFNVQEKQTKKNGLNRNNCLCAFIIFIL